MECCASDNGWVGGRGFIVLCIASRHGWFHLPDQEEVNTSGQHRAQTQDNVFEKMCVPCATDLTRNSQETAKRVRHGIDYRVFNDQDFAGQKIEASPPIQLWNALARRYSKRGLDIIYMGTSTDRITTAQMSRQRGYYETSTRLTSDKAWQNDYQSQSPTPTSTPRAS